MLYWHIADSQGSSTGREEGTSGGVDVSCFLGCSYRSVVQADSFLERFCGAHPELPGLSLWKSAKLIWKNGTMDLVLTFGYLDPGTGSMLLQAIVGGGAGVFVLIRHFWKALRVSASVSKESGQISPESLEATH